MAAVSRSVGAHIRGKEGVIYSRPGCNEATDTANHTTALRSTDLTGFSAAGNLTTAEDSLLERRSGACARARVYSQHGNEERSRSNRVSFGALEWGRFSAGTNLMFTPL